MNVFYMQIYDLTQCNRAKLKFYDVYFASGGDANKACTLFQSIKNVFIRDKIP